MDVPGFLQHLRRDDVGRPIPYINVLGPIRSQDRAIIAEDENAEGRRSIFFIDIPDDGPDFFQQSPQRQRECMVKGRCQVCRRYVPWPDRLLVISQISVHQVDTDGTAIHVVNEPWLDPECAAFAAERCPGLIRRRKADDFTLLGVTGPEQFQFVLSLAAPSGSSPDEFAADPLAMYWKIQLSPDKLRIESQAQ